MLNISKICDLLSKPTLLHITMPIVMIYLVAGTVAQKYIGLYQATEMFFASPIFWLGVVPLPGMPLFIAVIFLNLCFKIICKSPWVIHNAGIIITHIGAAILLFGGLITAILSHEGYVALAPNDVHHTVSDYHMREFAIIDTDGKETRFAHDTLFIGQNIPTAPLPLRIDVLEHCAHCTISARAEGDKTPNHIGMAQHMELNAAPERHNNEENMAGLTLRVTYNIQGNTHSEIHTILEDVPQIPSITVGDETYRLILRRTQRALPFSIELLDFEKEYHPGTGLAKSYQSRVLIRDGDLEWESVIAMNEPLRYKGYTFFQSSFVQTPNGELSVLAVVWNVGRNFPYISGLVMCFGLMLHIILRSRKGKTYA